MSTGAKFWLFILGLTSVMSYFIVSGMMTDSIDPNLRTQLILQMFLGNATCVGIFATLFYLLERTQNKGK